MRKSKSILLTLFFWAGCAELAPLREANQTLFVAFDAVPFSIAQHFQTAGEMPGFQPPTELISPFPSTTTTGFTGIFRTIGADPAPGYDAVYYDFEKEKMSGSLLGATKVVGKSYGDYFDQIRTTGFEQVVMYTLPSFAMKVDWMRVKPAIWSRPKKQNFFFYFGATDGAAHLDGKEATAKMFLKTVQKITQLQKEYETVFGHKLNVVLFSDHGFYWDEMKPIDVGALKTNLENQGVDLVDCCLSQNENGVVAVTWGNISGGNFYVKSGKAREILTKTLLQTEGVDLVFVREEDRIRVLARRPSPETGEIFGKEKGRFLKYQPIQGDPLKLEKALQHLSVGKNLDEEGFASRAKWFEITQDHLYPDAIFRIWDAFFGLSQNVASVLISTDENYEYGDNATRFFALIRGGLKGTHGALKRDSSSAFIMTTDPKIKLPNRLSYDKALTYFPKEQ